MKRPALLLLLALLACKRESPEPAKPEVLAGAKANPAASDDPWIAKAEPAPDPLKRVLLWSIAKDGKTSYAMGTMHLGIDPERLPTIVWDKVLGATAFAMETNMADGSLLNIGERTAGGSLQAELGPVYWEKLSKLVDAKLLAGLDKKKPLVAAMFLSMRGLPMTGLGMDMALHAKAQNAGKPLVYLEPASKQAELLARHMDIKALKLMIDTADQSADMMKQMVAAYTAGDDVKLLALNDAQKADALSHGYTEAEFDKQSNEMLYDRNASWIAAIEEMHKKGGGFIAVGALHLVGKRSVLDLLEANGYKIQRVEL